MNRSPRMMLRDAPGVMRKEHTLAEWLNCLWDGELEITRRGLSYASRFESASDPRHFTSRAKSLASPHEPSALLQSFVDRFGR
jgi:hypothetical protein